MKRWVTMTAVVGLVLTALATPGAHAASKTLYVGACNGASPYTTIQSAVDAVNDDDFTIYVCPGTYKESVTIANKEELAIRNYAVKNQSAPLIDPGSSALGFNVSDSKEVTIRGLHIAGANVAILAVRSPKIEVRNTIITASSTGIFIDIDCDKSKVEQNTITGDEGTGIFINMNSKVTIKQNTIASLDYGIVVGRCAS